MSTNSFKVKKSLGFAPQNAPTDPENGDMYLDSTDGVLYVFQNSVWNPILSGTAAEVQYDNASSGLTADNVQDAIDEVNTKIENIDPLPSQAGQNGKYLKTNGTTTSWDNPLPVQTAQAGKTLMTNGTTASWNDATPNNFIKQGDAELVTTGVRIYNDGDVAVPLDCTGGDATGVSVFRTASTVMGGNLYWGITKSIGSQRGKGVAFDFTIDDFSSSEQIRQELYTKFKAITGDFEFGENSDMQIFLYDRTKSQMVSLTGGNGILGPETLRWYSPESGSKDFTVCFHVATTKTDGYSVGVKDLSSGIAKPESRGVIAEPFKDAGPITIQAVTTNPVKASTRTIDKVSYGRVGDTANFIYSYSQPNNTGTSIGSGDYLFVLPDGLEFADSVPKNTSATITSITGIGSFSFITSQIGTGSIVPYDSRRFRVIFSFVGSTGILSSTFGQITTGALSYSINFSVPIKGWADGTVTLADQYPVSTAGTSFYTRASQCPKGSVKEGDTITRAQYPRLFEVWGIAGDTYKLDGEALVVRATGTQTFGGVTYTATLGQKRNDEIQGHRHSIEIGPSSGGSFLSMSGVNRNQSTGYVVDGIMATSMVSDGVNGTPRIGKETHGADIAWTMCWWAVDTHESLFRPDTFYPADIVTSEVQVGWDRTVTPNKPIYKRCHKVASDISNGTLVTWPTGLKSTNSLLYTTNGWVIAAFTFGANGTSVVYRENTGILDVSSSGSYSVKAGTTICMEYTKP